MAKRDLLSVSRLPCGARGRQQTVRCIAALLAVAAALTACSWPGGGASSAATPAPAAGAGRPNVVFVLTDDLAMNLVPYMPHVLALQKAGLSFSNYTVTDSLCCPSRSSIFSGKFPHDTGVFTNSGSDGGFGVFHSRGEESDTFATDLQKAGYRTAMMGKYLNGYQPKDALGTARPYVPPGWSEWDVAGNGYPEFGYDLNQNGTVVHHGRTPQDYLTDVLATKASDFVGSAADAHTPFLLEVATFAPHAPYTPAPADRDTFAGLAAPRTAAYDTLPTGGPSWLTGRAALTDKQKSTIDKDFRKRVQAVQSVDRLLARVEDTLRQRGIAGNTVVVFSSDNGYHMGEYRLMPGKMTAYDTDVRVPLVVAGPGITAGTTSAAVVQNIDLRPTFDSLAGIAVPAAVDGQGLLPLLHGQAPPGWRAAALVEHHGPDGDPADPDHPGKGAANPPSYEALRTATQTYVEYSTGEREFYDRATDPDELHDGAASLPAATLARLHTMLGALHTCHGAATCTTAGGGH